MTYFHPLRILRVVSASLAVTLILPTLANAARDSDKQNYRDDHDRRGGPHIVPVPEANTGIVLIPFVGAVLLFSSLRLLRLKAQKSGSLL